MMACDQEMCERWTGYGCACAVFDIERVWCYCYGTPEPSGNWVFPDDRHADVCEPEGGTR